METEEMMTARYMAEQSGKILGISTRYYPAQASLLGKEPALLGMDQTDDPPPTVTVLVAGGIGDYAAYTGHGKPEWVALHGDKIKFAEACIHFPGEQLKKELYRN